MGFIKRLYIILYIKKVKKSQNMLKNLRKRYSPNFNIDKRKAKDIKFVILHYTGMKNERLAIEKLTSFMIFCFRGKMELILFLQLL